MPVGSRHPDRPADEKYFLLRLLPLHLREVAEKHASRGIGPFGGFPGGRCQDDYTLASHAALPQSVGAQTMDGP
jgi:hypothetical protein